MAESAINLHKYDPFEGYLIAEALDGVIKAMHEGAKLVTEEISWCLKTLEGVREPPSRLFSRE